MTAAETYAALTRQAAIYDRDSSQRTAELIEANDALAPMLQTHRANPTIAGAERIAWHIAAMQRAANQLIVVQSKEANE